MQLHCHRLNAQQFCRAHPVRAPKAGHWLSAWPGASKNGATTGTVRESWMLPLAFHTQWLVKGSCFRNRHFTGDCFAFDDRKVRRFSQTFLSPRPWPAAFVEALVQLLGNSPTWVRAWGAHGKTAMHKPKTKPM